MVAIQPAGAHHDENPEPRSEARAPHVARGRRSRGASHPAAAAQAAPCERCGGAAAAEPETRAHREHRAAHDAHAHPHDQRLLVQLSLLPHAPRPRHAAHAAQAGGVRAHLPRRGGARMVHGALPHHGHPRPAGEGDGRSDRGADAAPREASLCRVHPREDGPRGGGGPDRAAHVAGDPRLDEPRGAVRRYSRAHRAGEKPRPPRSYSSSACAGR